MEETPRFSPCPFSFFVFVRLFFVFVFHEVIMMWTCVHELHENGVFVVVLFFCCCCFLLLFFQNGEHGIEELEQTQLDRSQTFIFNHLLLLSLLFKHQNKIETNLMETANLSV